MRQGDAPLLPKAHRGGHAGRIASVGILGPLPGEIQLAAGGPDEGADQRGRHANLTIARLAQRAAVLPFDADRVRALFRKAGVVDVARMPRRSGMSARRRAQTAAVDHGESVMKCWSAW